MSLEPDLQAIVDELKHAHPEGMSLDELADALSTKNVSYAEVEAIIAALDAEGFALDRPPPAASPDELARVLTAARALTQERGERPNVDEIAARAGLSPVAVRRALELGRDPGRS